MGTLMTWEFEWFKALHLLRDGQQLPRPPFHETMDSEKAEARIEVLKRLPLEKIVDEDPPPADYEPSKPGDRAGLFEWRAWAEAQRQAEIGNIRSMKPRQIQARAQRRQIWESLWRAKSRPAIRAACERWSRLADVRAQGFSPFPAHVLEHERAFLSMTANKRFPTSPAADGSRMEYISRGMAGLMVGRSPMTGIERLRNLKHAPGGALWSTQDSRCACWRCVIAFWHAFEQEAIRSEST
jgi:hypothetical protein